MPNIEKVPFQTNNAGCYQNTMLILLLPCLSYAHGKEVSPPYPHKTQDGKSVLDAHLAPSMQLITSWCKEGTYKNTYKNTYKKIHKL
jgi:hypothetical protein